LATFFSSSAPSAPSTPFLPQEQHLLVAYLCFIDSLFIFVSFIHYSSIPFCRNTTMAGAKGNKNNGVERKVI
jgi:hypothetical protein